LFEQEKITTLKTHKALKKMFIAICVYLKSAEEKEKSESDFLE
jgi:hypothetical protein